MSLRDYFAIKAVAAMIGTSAYPAWTLADYERASLAANAYAMADAMLTERAK